MELDGKPGMEFLLIESDWFGDWVELKIALNDLNVKN